MQTFITRRSWGKTAEDLDMRRAGNQRNEALTILRVLTGLEEGYENHPVLRMWRGYELALAVYGMQFCLEWYLHRGYHDKMFYGFYDISQDLKAEDPELGFELPPWSRDTDLMRSHRSNLLRRNERHYKGMWADCPESWPYLWPFIDGSVEGYKLMLSKADKARLKSGERTLPRQVMERVAN